MNASYAGWLVAGLVALIGLVVIWLTERHHRGPYKTREEVLEDQLTALEKKMAEDLKTYTERLDAADKQISLLLDRATEDRARIRALERETTELKRELEYYKALVPDAPKRKAAPRSKAKRLSGEQLSALRDEMLGTYTTHSQWKTLLGDIDRQIDTIATGESLADVASKVLTRANNEGWIDDLIAAAVDGRPDLTALKTLAAELAKVLQ